MNVTSPYLVTEGESVPNIRCWSECWPSCTHIWSPFSSHSGPSDILALGTVTRNTTENYTCTSTNTANQYIKDTEASFSLNIVEKRKYIRMFKST